MTFPVSQHANSRRLLFFSSLHAVYTLPTVHNDNAKNISSSGGGGGGDRRTFTRKGGPLVMMGKKRDGKCRKVKISGCFYRLSLFIY